MTLTVRQGKLLLKGSFLDQYTVWVFFFPLAKSNYTTETSQSIPSQANFKSAVKVCGVALSAVPEAYPIKPQLSLFFCAVNPIFPRVTASPYYRFLRNKVSSGCFALLTKTHHVTTDT